MARQRKKHHFWRNLLILIVLFGIYLYWGNRSIETDEATFTSGALPAGFDGCRIVQLSDLHGKYFGKGNDGKSTLSSQFKISKSDPRFSAIGTLDELAAEAYLCLAADPDADFNAAMREILEVIEKISGGMAYPRDSRYAVTENELSRVNELIASLSRFNEQSATPTNELASRLNLARTIARRAEREVVAADLKFAQVKRANAVAKGGANGMANATNAINAVNATNAGTATKNPTEGATDEERIVASVISKVMDKFSVTIGLDEAKILTDIIEKEAARRGKKAVVAVCNEQGNPISVHVMDGAFLVSFDVAVKKAYTAAALKMSTMELSALVKPNATFYGLQNDEKLMIIGGGVPIVKNGKVVGGLGVSGGTGEEDHSLCEYALAEYARITK